MLDDILVRSLIIDDEIVVNSFVIKVSIGTPNRDHRRLKGILIHDRPKCDDVLNVS